MWSDNETSLDLIGFQVHADLIRSVVTNPKMLPVTIGLFGDWGSGKTSIMQMLQRDLEPTRWPANSEEKLICEKVACLYFNGWLFEGYDDAKSAILSSILQALGEHKRFGPKVRDRVASLLKSVNWGRVIRLGMKHVALPVAAAYLSGGATTIPSAAALMGSAMTWDLAGGLACDNDSAGAEQGGKGEGVDWGALIRTCPDRDEIMDVRRFREQFAALLAECDIDSLVVLIDDLDRCSPERVIENLEAIKLFLSVDRTAFVIGADPRIVRHAIAWRYRQYDEGRQEGAGEEAASLITDYLEKLIQVPYHLPRLSPAETETYMALLFCHKAFTPEVFVKCMKAVDVQRKANRYGVFGYGAIDATCGPLPQALADSLLLCGQAAPLITDGLKGNPRQVKRFLNAFFLRRQLAEVAGLDNIRDDVLVKLMILEYASEEQFRELADWQGSQDGHPKQLGDMELAVRSATEAGDPPEKIKTMEKSWNTPRLRKWLSMNPALAGVDLRDYFWVARDRLESTLSGVAMVSPVVRRIAERVLSGKAVQVQEGVKSACGCDRNDIRVMLGLLKDHITRHPSEKAGFEGVMALINAGVDGAADVLAAIISTQPLEKMPPAAGSQINVLLKTTPQLRTILKPATDRLRGSDSRIGKAFQTTES